MLCFGGAFVLLLVIIVNFSVLEESVHHVQCVIIVQLQQEPSFIIYVSIAMLANHTFAHTSIFPNVCIEISQLM